MSAAATASRRSVARQRSRRPAQPHLEIGERREYVLILFLPPMKRAPHAIETPHRFHR